MTARRQLLARAAALQALARGFAYPDAGFLQDLAGGAFRQEVTDALAMLGLKQPSQDAAIQEALSQAESTPGTLEGEYTYLFSRNVLSPPNETSYTPDQTFQRVQQMSDIASFYAAFGFRIAPGKHELPDHVGAELEFVAMLYAKEAYAQEQGKAEQALLCKEARDKFLEEHMGRWVPAFLQRLREHERLPFYSALAAAADRVLSMEPAYKTALAASQEV